MDELLIRNNENSMLDTDNIIDHYGRVASFYNSPANKRFYAGLATRLCLSLSNTRVSPKTIIEIGCGSGIGTTVIKKHFPGAGLIAIDPSGPFIEIARGCDNGVRYIRGRLQDISGIEKTDLIVGNMCFHWLNRDDLMAVARFVKPGGTAAFTVPLRRPEAFADRPGNRLLLQAYKAVMDRGSIAQTPGNWRGMNLSHTGLSGLHLTDLQEMEFIELLPVAEFIDIIVSRGITLALYGPRAAIAAEWLASRLPGTGQIELGWKIGILIALRDPILKHHLKTE